MEQADKFEATMKYCLPIVFLFIQSVYSISEDITKTTDTLRAIYLYKMGLYVSTRPNTNIIKIGVIGEDRIIRMLNKLRKREGFEQKYEVHEFDELKSYQKMHVVYLPGRFYDQASMRSLLVQKTLVVGNNDFCWVRDYHICLFQDGDTLKFKANVSQMDKTGIKISSKLLRLSIETR